MSDSRSGAYRALLPWCIAVGGFIASAIAFWFVRHDEHGRIENEFNRRAGSITYLFQKALDQQVESLQSIVNIFRYSDSVTREEFENAAQELMVRNSSLLGVRWAPRVMDVDRAAFIASARAQGIANFDIIEPTEKRSFVTALNRDVYYPVLYEVARRPGFQSTGIDLRRSPRWREFEAAAQSADSHTSSRITLFYPDENNVASAVFLAMAPMFANEFQPTGASQPGPLLGLLAGNFRPADIVDECIGALPKVGIDILLIDTTTPANPRVLCFRPSSMREAPPSSPPLPETIQRKMHHKLVSNLSGHTVELWLSPVPEWVSSQETNKDVVVAISTLICSLMIALWVRVIVRRTRVVEQQVAERTRELTAAQRDLREDIRRRIEAEHALKASEERYRHFVSQSSDAIWRLELPQAVPLELPVEEQVERILNTSRVAECNNNTALLYGHGSTGDMLGKSLGDLTPGSRARHASTLHVFIRSGYRLSDHEAEETTPGAEPRFFRLDLIGVVENNRLARIWISEREFTHQKRLEQEKRGFEQRLSETQRLESLGVLAGGIAHDFNNLLTGILGHASLARTEIEPDSHLTSHLEQIESASRSAAGLCQQMLAYAGKGRFIVKPHDLSAIVSETAHLLQVSVGKHADLHYNLARNLPLVMADGTQLQQIVMNLVINAAEAIGPRRGHIGLTTGVAIPDAATFTGCAYVPEKKSASYVYLEVRDDGCGMSPEMRTRIFEPFFTTKFSGRGLGLAATIGIVRSHDGALKVDSAPGQGSTFTIFFPASTETVSHAPQPGGTNTPWSGEGTILVIDDEPPVRGVAERMAQNAGFSALTAPDGARGVELFRAHHASVKLILLDITMPGMTCAEALTALRSIDPATPIVIMSGYNQPDNLSMAANNPMPFLPKPFTLSQFKTVVRSALNPARHPTSDIRPPASGL